MRNPLFRGMFLIAGLTVSLVAFSSETALGQRQEPRIEGVSYTEIAEWQSNYGGGPFLRRGYGPGCFMPPPHIVEYCPEDEPPVARKPKRKTKDSSK